MDQTPSTSKGKVTKRQRLLALDSPRTPSGKPVDPTPSTSTPVSDSSHPVGRSLDERGGKAPPHLPTGMPDTSHPVGGLLDERGGKAPSHLPTMGESPNESPNDLSELLKSNNSDEASLMAAVDQIEVNNVSEPDTSHPVGGLLDERGGKAPPHLPINDGSPKDNANDLSELLRSNNSDEASLMAAVDQVEVTNVTEQANLSNEPSLILSEPGNSSATEVLLAAMKNTRSQ